MLFLNLHSFMIFPDVSSLVDALIGVFVKVSVRRFFHSPVHF